MASEIKRGEGPGSGKPGIGLLYTTMSGVGREDNKLPSAMDMIGNISVTSQFKVSLHLPVGGTKKLEKWLSQEGLLENVSQVTTYDFLCNEASLPGTAFNTYDEKGSRQGVVEPFISAGRQHSDFRLSFYIDTEYKMVRLFEEWINFMNPLYTYGGKKVTPNKSGSGYSNAKNRPDYFRMEYPDEYKRIISVTKFERDFLRDPTKSPGSSGSNFKQQTMLTYRMIDAFPVNITPIPVTYEGSVVTKSSISFAYSRYVIERTNSESPV